MNKDLKMILIYLGAFLVVVGVGFAIYATVAASLADDKSGLYGLSVGAIVGGFIALFGGLMMIIALKEVKLPFGITIQEDDHEQDEAPVIPPTGIPIPPDATVLKGPPVDPK